LYTEEIAPLLAEGTLEDQDVSDINFLTPMPPQHTKSGQKFGTEAFHNRIKAIHHREATPFSTNQDFNKDKNANLIPSAGKYGDIIYFF
jgi:hypothetical protein